MTTAKGYFTVSRLVLVLTLAFALGLAHEQELTTLHEGAVGIGTLSTMKYSILVDTASEISAN